MSYPAKLITTSLDWDGLILENQSLEEIYEILDWLKHGDTLLNEWGLRNKIKPGFRALFCGPPGTGKTLTACLLGKSAGRDVYKLDLSMLLSKNIAETEEILNCVFNEAKNRNLMLFLDEADSFFKEDTKAKSLNDHHFDQKTVNLLQRIEDFSGVMMMASNLKSNLDEAFRRRFQSIIYFPMPNSCQRKILWQNSFTGNMVLSDDIQLEDIAEKYELSGGSIITVLRYCSLMALKNGRKVILRNEILEGISLEFRKDKKVVG
jgi:SpoVK/Ycf46/Vps4 family AAA+-type ATPase